MSFLPRLVQRTSFGARARSLPTLSRPIRSSSPAWPPIVSLPSRQLSSRPLSSLPPAVRRPRTSPIPELSRISWARPALGLRRYASFYGGGGSKRGQDPVGDMLSRLNQLDPMHLVFGLIGLNVAIFAGWQYASSSYQRFGDPSAFLAMGRHFTASLVNLKEGRVWSLITSCFSHSTTSHILMNMLSLYFCAPVVIGVVGNVGFMALYLFAGIAASTTSLLYSSLYAGNHAYASNGATGAIYGTLAFFAAYAPKTTFMLFFVIPAPAWALVSGIFAYDLYSTLRRRGGAPESAGNIGGAGAGLLFFARIMGRF